MDCNRKCLDKVKRFISKRWLDLYNWIYPPRCDKCGKRYCD